ISCPSTSTLFPYTTLFRSEVYEQEHPLKMTSDEKIIFYDTETTGLKGVGTHIFLNGLLEETSDGFVLKQYILADPANEVAFLFEDRKSTRLNSSHVKISYA